MGGIGVQFRGIPKVMKAFDNCKIIAWAVFYGKALNCKYNGQDNQQSRETLEQYLQLVGQSGSSAVYTLKLYEDLPKNGKIKPSTEEDYAFNFTLWDEMDEDNPPPYRTYQQRNQSSNQILLDKITALEAKLAAAEEYDDEEQEEGVMGVINGIVGSEKFKTWLQDKALGFADRLFDKPANIIPMGNAARVGAIDQNSPILIDEEQQRKASEAIEILARCDANLGDNLLKIAAIASNDPGKYKAFASML